MILRIDVCRTQQDAIKAAQKLKLEGFQVISSKSYERVYWNGDAAGSTDEICNNVWVVQGEK